MGYFGGFGKKETSEQLSENNQPFKIGDWVEFYEKHEKIKGQVEVIYINSVIVKLMQENQKDYFKDFPHEKTVVSKKRCEVLI